MQTVRIGLIKKKAEAFVLQDQISQKHSTFCEIPTFFCCDFHKKMVLFVKK